jgi:hypothetical protein
MIFDKPKKKNLYSDIKEKSIRTHYKSESKHKYAVEEKGSNDLNKQYLIFEPPEVLLQNIELKKVYEIPVRVQNLSTTSKRILIKKPKEGYFKILSDKAQKNLLISPGLYYEFLVVFEAGENKDYHDDIIVISENLEIKLPLNAMKCQPILVFDPFINFGFVPIKGKKSEKILFVNEGLEGCTVELRLTNKNYNEIEINDYRFVIGKKLKNKRLDDDPLNYFETTINYSPETHGTIDQRIEVINFTENSTLGFIDLIGTSIEQQLSVVFEEGGGPKTEVNFGKMFYGQYKDCPAFLVNNGPYEIEFRIFFHVGKDKNDPNLKLDDSDFACTPEQAGIEMTQRVLGCSVKQGLIKPYQQMPIIFQAKTKLSERQKKWGGHICEENLPIMSKEFLQNELNEVNVLNSIAAIKFDQAYVKNDKNEGNDEKICSTLSVYMEVKTVYPHLVIDKTAINFTEIYLGETACAKLRISNKNEDLPIDYYFEKMPFFNVEPYKGIINKGNSITVNVTFTPKNYGIFSTFLKLKYINKLYEIKIKVFGNAKLPTKKDNEVINTIFEKNLIIYNPLSTENNFMTTNNFNTTNNSHYLTTFNNNSKLSLFGKTLNSNKIEFKKKVFGPEATDIDFTKNVKMLTDSESMNYTKNIYKNSNAYSLLKQTDKNFNDQLNKLEKEGHNPSILENECKLFMEYKERQNQAVKSNRDIYYLSKVLKNKNNLKDMDMTINDNVSTQFPSTNLNNKKEESLLDKLMSRVPSPKIELEINKENLYVVRPIGKYEPKDTFDKIANRPVFDPKQKPDDVKIKYPNSTLEKKECEMTLDGEKLVRIIVSSGEVNFGDVFKGSEEKRTFWIKNELRTNIFVEFIIEDNPELKSYSNKSLVIAPNSFEGTELTFSSHKIKLHSFYIKYKINYKHQFKVKITANVVYSTLKLANPNFSLNKFTFHQINNSEMTVSQILPLCNTGNAKVCFNFENGKTGHFQITPTSGEVLPEQEINLTISFDALDVDIKKDIYDELKCNIIDGQIMSFPVIGQIMPCKAEFVGGDILNFGEISNGVYEKRYFIIRCDKGGPTAFKIMCNSDWITIEEKKGILDNKDKKIEICLKCDNIGNFKEQIKIKIRGGGQPLILTVLANAIEPTVVLDTNLIDFGEASFGDNEKRKLTLINKSNLNGFVTFDLRPIEFKFFKILLSEKYKGKKDYCINDLEKDGEEDEDNYENVSNEGNKETEDEPITPKSKKSGIKKEGESSTNLVLIEENKFSNLRYFEAQVQSNESLEFQFIFCPGNETVMRTYQSTLKLVMKGTTNDNPALSLDIIAKQKESLITLNPREKITFKKTFIGKSDKTQSTSYAFLKVYSNNIKDQKFIVDTNKLDKVFSIEEFYEEKDRQMGKKRKYNPNTKECVLSESSMEVIFKCSFSPTEEKTYESQLFFKPINDLGDFEKEKEIKFKGEGALPKITFSKREIILPIVPLGIDSKSSVKIRNEGYGEMSLDCKIISEIRDISIKVNWLDGNKIGILKNELRLDVIFKNKNNKPLGFTCKLQIIDQDNRKFFIYIHGVTDNCLLTNYSFFQINNINHEFIGEEYDNFNVRESINSGNEISIIEDDLITGESKKKDNLDKSILEMTYTKQYRTTLISNCKYLLSLLNNVLSSAIISFPESLANDYNKGENLINLIENLSGKPLDIKLERLDDEPLDRARQIREFYYKILYNLQEQGALLNTVLPEYLLEKKLFKKYVKNDEKYSKIVLPLGWEQSTKVLNYYKFVHMESWITLIYQIFKLYYLSRVNTVSYMKALRHLPDETKKGLEKNLRTNSNFYSSNELLLLKWVRFCCENVNNQQMPIYKHFSDLTEGYSLLNLIIFYLPHIEDSLRSNKKKSANLDKEGKVSQQIEKFFGVLKEYGVLTHISQDDINELDDREIVIFIIMLFQYLPYFIPTPIYFSSILNESISQNIVLSNNNTNKKKIEYSIKKFGSNDFVVNKDIVDIRILWGEPVINYKITFKCRFKSEVRSKIFFLNRINGLMYQAVPLVYELISNVTERRSIGEVIKYKAPLYKKTEHKLNMRCPFNFKGDFRILPPDIRRKNPRYKKKTYGGSRHHEEEEIVAPIISFKNSDPFFSYRLEPDSQRDITFYFCPIDTDTYIVDLIFYNESLGEFQITIELSPDPPEILETFNLEAEVNEQKDLPIEIKYINKYMKQAIDNVVNNESKDKQQALRKLIDYKIDTKTNFSIDISRLYFQTSGSFSIDPIVSTDKTYDQQTQTLYLKFSSKSVQTVETDLVIKNLDKYNDIRIYRLIIKVKPKNIFGTMLFNCPANQEIIQTIPFHNLNDKECILKIDISQIPNKGYFSIVSEKRIPKGKTEIISLKFCPIERINIKGTVNIKNTLTGEQYEYKIEGKVDDPLAEDMITIDCPVRKEERRKIMFENTYDDEVTYRVETDLCDVLSGPEKFSVKGKSKYEYEFTVRPLLGKIYFGKLTFKPEKMNTYKWYTIKIQSKSILENDVIQMKTQIRKTIYVDILLENPLNERILYDVEYEGNFLNGERLVSIEAKKTKNYRLYFSPLKVGYSDGLIHIYNEKIGERIVKLILNSEESKPVYVDTMIAELGKFTEYSLILENPLDEEVEVYVNQSNKSQFEVIPEKIIIPENSGREIIVKYTPSQLEHAEDCRIIFDTVSIGKWEYYFKGKGSFPSAMAKTVISSYVGGSVSGNVIFKNPFNDKISINVDLLVTEDNLNATSGFNNMNIKHNNSETKENEMSKEAKSIFTLLLEKRRQNVDNYKIFQIPFAFFPKKLVKYHAEIVVSSSNLKWIFPIEGITEVKSKELDFYFKTKSKKELDTKVILDMSAVPDSIDISELSIETKVLDTRYKQIIDKCLTLSLDYPIFKNDEELKNRVPLIVKFYPLRPFKTECEICIIKRSGGQWIYNIIFESLEGDPEDIIKIQSSIGKETIVSFKLQNIFTKNAKYIAYFTHDSSSEFNIKPKEGILDQSGRAGNTFLISFLPIEYGKVKIGKLVIETDEVQWIYQVHGSHLEYILPEVKSNLFGKTMSSIAKTGDSTNLKTTVTKFKNLNKGNEKFEKIEDLMGITLYSSTEGNNTNYTGTKFDWKKKI